MSELKRDKAAELDEITSEHILFSHPALSLVLTRLFNIILANGVQNTGVKELNVSDFRGISDYQMGFKKGISCSHAIYSFRKVADHYTINGSTVNVCTLDLSKAFDKVNHSAFFVGKTYEQKCSSQFTYAS